MITNTLLSLNQLYFGSLRVEKRILLTKMSFKLSFKLNQALLSPLSQFNANY